jgi:hypothetical protein
MNFVSVVRIDLATSGGVGVPANVTVLQGEIAAVEPARRTRSN